MVWRRSRVTMWRWQPTPSKEVESEVTKLFAQQLRTVSHWILAVNENNPSIHFSLNHATITELYTIMILLTHCCQSLRSHIKVFIFSSVPSPPEDVKATSVSQDTILLSWKQPVHKNGEILSYTLYKRYERSVSTLTVPGTERHFTFKGRDTVWSKICKIMSKLQLA